MIDFPTIGPTINWINHPPTFGYNTLGAWMKWLTTPGIVLVCLNKLSQTPVKESN